MSTTSEFENIVELDYHDLAAGKDLIEQVTDAFGPDGVGLLVVKNVPGFVEARDALLPHAHKLGNLPSEQLAKYEHAPSCYSVGWSKGREMLAKDVPDTRKGSFYANPLTDQVSDDEKLIEEFPGIFTPNIWPTKEIPELEHSFKTMGQLMFKVAVLLGKQCSALAERNGGKFSIQGTTERSVAKGRLLYYYPRDEDAAEDDMWCGWHNDHGSLTALCPSMYFDEEGQQTSCTDKRAGLRVKTRSGKQLMLRGISKDVMAFQIGEAAQITSAGAMCATPHAVIGPKLTGISRAAFALFMDPLHDVELAPVSGTKIEDIQDTKHLPKNIPPLASRWDPSRWSGNDNTYGAYSERTYAAYYPYLNEKEKSPSPEEKAES